VSVVDALLKSGAEVNPTAVCKTPLQVAIERVHDSDVIKMLLAAGADVNAVGDPQAVVDDITARRQEVSTRRDSESVEAYCDTPLRLAENILNQRRVALRLKEKPSQVELDDISSLTTTCNILQEKGAVSRSQAVDPLFLEPKTPSILPTVPVHDCTSLRRSGP
jgi:ankyrin repeat protein